MADWVVDIEGPGTAELSGEFRLALVEMGLGLQVNDKSDSRQTACQRLGAPPEEVVNNICRVAIRHSHPLVADNSGRNHS